MILDDMSDLDKNALIFNIACLSPSAAKSLELESYRLSAQWDGSDNQYILEDVFQKLISDIESIGLSIQYDYRECLVDFSEMTHFIKTCEFLLPNTLYPTICNQNSIRELIAHITSGSLGGEEQMISVYLSELGGLDDSPALVPELTEFLDRFTPQITQTGNFSDYLKNLLDLYYLEKPIATNDAERHRAYRDRVKQIIGKVGDAAQVIDKTYQCDLMPELNFFTRDLLAVDNFVWYAYIFLEREDTLPPDLIESYQRRWYHYFGSHPWGYDYYTVRKIVPNERQRFLIAAVCYGLSDTYSEYAKNISALRKTFQNESLDSAIALLYRT